MFLSPLIAEILPGSTRFSSIFVFPIEMLVWGGGALLIRYIARKMNLDWKSILLMGLALSIAEEFIIQQTSLAPMVVQIKGITYARAFGVNYVYLLWAMIYETVFVVLIPIGLTQIIFRKRSAELWIGKPGVIITSVLFILGSFMAWYSWTRIARPAVFHVPLFNPSIMEVSSAVLLIAGLIFTAIRLKKNHVSFKSPVLALPASWILVSSGLLWAVILYIIVILAFGVLPSFPPALAIFIGLILIASASYFLPGWFHNSDWQNKHSYSVIFGVILGSMVAGFVGFIGAAPLDLYFKILSNLIALMFLIWIWFKVRRNATAPEV
jgi:hypothetical protein